MAKNITTLGELKSSSETPVVIPTRDPKIVHDELQLVAEGLRECLAFMKARLAKNKKLDAN